MNKTYGLELETSLCIADSNYQQMLWHSDYLRVRIADRIIFSVQGDMEMKYRSIFRGIKSYHTLEIVSNVYNNIDDYELLTNGINIFYNYIRDMVTIGCCGNVSAASFLDTDAVINIGDDYLLEVIKPCVIWGSQLMVHNWMNQAIIPPENMEVGVQVTIGLEKDMLHSNIEDLNGNVRMTTLSQVVPACFNEMDFLDTLRDLYKEKYHPFSRQSYNTFISQLILLDFNRDMKGFCKKNKDKLIMLWSSIEFLRLYFLQTLISPLFGLVIFGAKSYMRLLSRIALRPIISDQLSNLFNRYEQQTVRNIIYKYIIDYTEENFELATPFPNGFQNEVMGIGNTEPQRENRNILEAARTNIVNVRCMILSVVYDDTPANELQLLDQSITNNEDRIIFNYNANFLNDSDRVDNIVNVSKNLIKTYDWLSPAPLSPPTDPMGAYTRNNSAKQRFILELRNLDNPMTLNDVTDQVRNMIFNLLYNS